MFSIPVGVVYRPNEAKVRNLKTKDYLGKARLVAASDRSNAFTGFAGSEIKNVSTSSLPACTSFAYLSLPRPKQKPKTTDRPKTCLLRRQTWSSQASNPEDSSPNHRPTAITFLPHLHRRTTASHLEVLLYATLEGGRTPRSLASRHKRAVGDMRRLHLHKTAPRNTRARYRLRLLEASLQENPLGDSVLLKKSPHMAMNHTMGMVKARGEASNLDLDDTTMTTKGRIMTTAPLTRASSRWYLMCDVAQDPYLDHPVRLRDDPTFARFGSRFTQTT